MEYLAKFPELHASAKGCPGFETMFYHWSDLQKSRGTVARHNQDERLERTEWSSMLVTTVHDNMEKECGSYATT